jgi:dihydroorotase
MRALLLGSALLLAVSATAQQYDLLLKGGHVIDPRNNIDANMDVAVAGGRIAAVAANIDRSLAKQTVDASGLYVTPGLVDMHVHLFATTGLRDAWAGDNSVYPDGFSFRTGVTTMVDAGTAGWRNFDTFRHTVIDRAQTRVFAMINIAGLGMSTNAAEQVISEFQPDQVARIAAKHKDIVVGVKSAHYEGPDWTSVDKAVEAGKLANIPVMVDFGFFRAERPYYQLVTEHLRPGDISTHCFRSAVPWVDEKQKVYDYLQRARARGVKFDVGHGGGSFVFRNAVPATEQGFYPDTISTDLHTGNMNAAMKDMTITMSKFLVMGMPMKEIILRSTWNPAQTIHHPEVGHLTVGSPADVAVLRIEKGTFAYEDSAGGRLNGTQKILCEMTIRDGKVAWDLNARAATDYKTLGPSYGLRPGGADVVVRPK